VGLPPTSQLKKRDSEQEDPFGTGTELRSGGHEKNGKNARFLGFGGVAPRDLLAHSLTAATAAAASADAAAAAAAIADAAAAARRAPPARRLRFDIIHHSSNCTRERFLMRAGGSATAANAVLLRMRHSTTRVRVFNFGLAVRGVSAAAVGAVGAAGTSAICKLAQPAPPQSQKTQCASSDRHSRAHRRQHRRLHRPRPPSRLPSQLYGRTRLEWRHNTLFPFHERRPPRYASASAMLSQFFSPPKI